ncbi:MAG: hypothetical protein AAF703_15675 [Cyanobacteria bacterium P01_D01_bin.105]
MKNRSIALGIFSFLGILLLSQLFSESACASKGKMTVVSFRGQDISFLRRQNKTCERGLDIFSNALQDKFSSEIILSNKVFEFNEVEDALQWVKGVGDLGCLVSVGNSRGGVAVVKFAKELLKDNRDVNLTVQIDSVDLPYESTKDSRLPENVLYGINYFVSNDVISQRLGSEQAVDGAINLDIQSLGIKCIGSSSNCGHFNVHASSDLHDLILHEVEKTCRVVL